MYGEPMDNQIIDKDGSQGIAFNNKTVPSDQCEFIAFLLPSCQFATYMSVSMSWTDMAFCFMAAASNHHMDDLGCTCTPF
jgi:hypothetical protein